MHSEVTCREMLTFLAEYLSGVLPPARREAFDEHLARCPECVAYLNNYQAIIGLAKRSAEPVPDEVPQDLVTALLAVRALPSATPPGPAAPPR